MTISTMDTPFSPDMGGKEGLSALGWSRVRLMGDDGYPPELWGNDIGDAMWVDTTGVKVTHRLKYAGHDMAQPIKRDELIAAAKRIEELKAGDAE